MALNFTVMIVLKSRAVMALISRVIMVFNFGVLMALNSKAEVVHNSGAVVALNFRVVMALNWSTYDFKLHSRHGSGLWFITVEPL